MLEKKIKIVLRHTSYVKIKQPPVSWRVWELFPIRASYRTRCDLFIIHPVVSMPRTILALVYIYRIWVTLARGQIWLACDLWQAAVQVSAIVCRREVQLQRLSLLPTQSQLQQQRRRRRQSPDWSYKTQRLAAWLSALSTPLGSSNHSRTAVCEWKWTNHWWASASVASSFTWASVQVIQSSFCRRRDQLVAAVLSTSCARALTLPLCLFVFCVHAVCVCVCMPHATVV